MTLRLKDLNQFDEPRAASIGIEAERVSDLLNLHWRMFGESDAGSIRDTLAALLREKDSHEEISDENLN